MHLLGFDIGSSSVKVTLLNAETGQKVVAATSPKKEMAIIAKKPGWAEQHPQAWWENAKLATAEVRTAAGSALADVKAIGISYQMHGLVVVDKNQQVLRPAIIWCDSRAVETGARAFKKIGEKKCLKTLLNSPGNFTASKLKWVKDNELSLYKKIHKFMLPGDYLAMQLTGEIVTTPSGLSEGILWDFGRQSVAVMVLEHYGIAAELVPRVVPTFTAQGQVTRAAAAELGIPAGIPVSYRAGDQPNNALSLNVLEPGEIAATAGTSGVVYGVGNKPNYDPQSRVNTFVHVSHTARAPRYGVLLCLNGTGILNSWAKHNLMAAGLDYPAMNELAATVPAGAGGLAVLPYGNGAERTLGNRELGASIHGLSFTTHTGAHLARAAQEGIVFALNYGVEIMKGMGIGVKKVRAGHANMFLSPLFGQAFATVTGAQVELFDTDGSQGAARGAGIGAEIYRKPQEAFIGLTALKVIRPDQRLSRAYHQAYACWKNILDRQLRAQ